MSEEAWHYLTVAGLAAALLGEMHAAYCAQRARLGEYLRPENDGSFSGYSDRVEAAFAERIPWIWLWGRHHQEPDLRQDEEHKREYGVRMEHSFRPHLNTWSRPHVGHLTKGLGRLTLATVLLARFAADESFSWLRLFG